MRKIKFLTLIAIIATVLGCVSNAPERPAAAAANGAAKTSAATPIYADDPRLRVPQFVCGPSVKGAFGDDTIAQICVDPGTGHRYVKGWLGNGHGGPFFARLWD